MKILDQLRLKSKAEQSMAKAHIYFFWGGHRTETVQTGKWGHRTYLLNGGNNWGWEKTYIGMWGGDTTHTFLMGGTTGVGEKYTGGGHRTYFVDGGNNRGGDTAQH